MEQITYAMVIQFFRYKENYQNRDVAEWLGLNNGTVSGIASGKRSLNRDITYGMFYEDVFEDMGHVSKKYVDHLYEFLKEQDALPEAIKVLYEKCNAAGRAKQEETCKEFIMAVLREADQAREERILGKKIGSKAQRAKEKKGCFAPFSNPVVKGFIGRTELLRRIGETLAQHNIAVICGIGGLGKSQAALAYAKEQQEIGTYQQVQCVFFEESLAATILRIPFEGLTDYQDTNPSERLRHRLKALCDFGTDTLLIIDNVDQELGDADKALLGELRLMPLHLLITSRNNKLERAEYRIPIEPLSAEDQYRLFLRHYGVDALPEDEKEAYVRLFEKVRGHTMLIELIAKTMQTDAMKPAEMMRVLESGDDSDLTAVELEKDRKWENETIYRFVASLFDSTKLSAEEKNILVRLAYAPARGLRLRLLKDYFLQARDFGTLTRLVQLSWITRDIEGIPTNHRIHIHPVICTAVTQNLKPTLATLTDYIETVLRTCASDAHEITAEDQDDLHVLLANLGREFISSYDATTLPLIKEQIGELRRYNKYEPARQLTGRAVEICRECTAHMAELPILLRWAADLNVSLADYPAAIEAYTEAIARWEALPEPPADRIADAYNHLANVHRKASRHEEALNNFQRAEEWLSDGAEEYRNLRADILNNIGIVYINLHKYTESLNYYEQGLALREKMCAEQPENLQYLRDLAYSYHNIGTVYQKKGDAEAALRWHTNALHRREEIYPKNDPVIADSTNMIGNDYTLMAKSEGRPELYKTAMEYLQKSLRIRQEILGPRHPAVAWSYFSIGQMYAEQGNEENALAYYEKCLDIRKERLGMLHSYTEEVIEEMGRTYARMGRKADADEYLRQAAEIREARDKDRQEKSRTAIKTDRIKRQK